ncbi:MAG: YkgJ family cysteine cluster protein [Bdellovibrionales bacterium]|nr:YkgJ family cysteine cluster protein [Bdellovibrionales bacterium]
MSESASEKQEWWNKGVRFQCQGSGKCCISRGEYGYVYLTLSDRQRFAKHFDMRTSSFTRKFCEQTEGIWHLKTDPQTKDCLFLLENKCSVYKARPTQCRTWPFWPEVMNAKSWKKEVASFCPGVGKGPVISAQKISKALKEQTQSEKELMGPDKLITPLQ